MAQLGPFTLYTYTVLIDLGIAVALAALYLQAPAGKQVLWLDIGLAATVGGFLGARLLYVSLNASYYLPHIDEVVQVWQGGLAWPGAPAGALLGAWVFARTRREGLARLVDALALPAGLLSLLSWGGCLAAGCAYGYEVTPGQLPGWLVSQAPDLYGVVVPRFPTQALGVAWSVLALLAIWGTLRAQRQSGRRWAAGAVGAYALSLAALGVFLLSFTRGDPARMVSGFRIDVVGSALVLVVTTAAWAWRLTRARSRDDSADAALPAAAGDSPPSGASTVDPIPDS